ncbi:Mitochondrial import inner membrane translocase subunit Tim10 [Triticum urartu]|uniref:Mitochondrial import inner membrane translocase subunit n=1 Tax=Triticum urartu TaxID=4572 RepID=M8A3G8_TRIUA|nr:Mitochondrial import inner membrane translocase subunit Tim10 [Triticum urartu]
MAAAKDVRSELEKEMMFGMAEKEMEYRVELFNRLTHVCFEKCIDKRHKEGELNMGENSCIDRNNNAQRFKYLHSFDTLPNPSCGFFFSGD